MALTGLAIAAALGLAKSELVDKPKEDRQRALAARTEALSPWTGMHGKAVKEADPFGTALAYGATGAQMGQNYETAQAAKNNPWGAAQFKPKAQALPGESDLWSGSDYPPVKNSGWNT